MNLQGRIALVTGANRGLGLALTGALRAAGARKIYAGARNPNGAAIEGAEIVPLDVTEPNSVAAAAARSATSTFSSTMLESRCLAQVSPTTPSTGLDRSWKRTFSASGP